MVHTLKDSSILHSKLKPLYWAILLVLSTGQQARAAVIDYTDGEDKTGVINLTDNSTQLQVTTGTATQSGSINGSFSLEKTGSGILIFSGGNNYTGNTNITAGTLRLLNGNAIRNTSGTVNVSAGATLNVAASEAIDDFIGAGTTSINAGQTLTLGVNSGATAANKEYSGVITGAGNLYSIGNRTLSGNNDYTGTTTVNYGTVTVSATGDINESSAISILAAGTLNIDGGGNAAIGDGVAVSNAGNFILTGSDETIGSINGAGNINLHGQTLTTGGDGTSTTLSGVISGSGGGLTKQGTGTFTLSGANTYTGATTISAGILRASNTTALGSNSAVTVGGGSLDLTTDLSIGSLAGAGNVTLNANTLTTGGNNTSTSYSGILSGTGGLIKQGSGTQTLSGSNTYSGGTTVSGGTLQGTTTSLQGNITNNANVTFDQTTTGTYAGVVSGTGSLTKANTGTVTLSGANTYTGATNINAGILQASNTSALGSNSAVTVGGGSLDLTTDLSIGSLAGTGNVTLNANTLTTGGNNTSTNYSGVLSGAGGLTKQGSGTQTLSGANTYSGGTTVNGGTLQGTTTSLQGNITNNANVTFDQSTSGTYAGVMSGTGSLTKANTGTVTLSGANTYTGATTINAGILQASNTSALGSNSAVTVGGGSLDLTTDLSIGSLAGTGNVTLNANTLTTGGNNTSTSYSGILSGAGGLTKQGSGTQTLSGANTYIGGTTVNGGTLQGTTTSLQGNITNNANVTFDQSTSGTYAGVMSGTGGLTKTSTGTVTLSGANTYSGGTTVSGGTLQGTTTSLQGNITNNANVTFDQSTSGTYAGVMSGTGGLTKTNTGTVTLSGANTYTGDTTITDGTLQLGSSNRIADTSNLVINDGKFDLNGFNETVANLSGTGGLIDLGNTGSNSLTVNQTVDGTYAGNFAGNNSNPNSFNSSLIKNGNATLTLSGTSTQTGGNLITIIAGRLAVTGGNAIADTYIVNGSGEFELLGDETIGFLMMNSAGKVLLNNNTLTIGTTSGASTAAYNRADISGSGNIVINGVGNQLFNGASTYTGSTTINSGKLSALNSSALGNNSAVTVNTAGTLELANDLSIGSLAGDGTVNLSGSGSNSLSIGGDNTSTVFSGVVSGAGGNLIKTGTGTLSLTGTNTYTGGTTVSGGTLQGTTTSLQGNITNNANVTFDQSTSGTYAGVVSGTGSFSKSNSGNLNLTGVNTYTGTTTINGGILSVNGSIANSATTVNTNGQLGGNGNVGSVTLAGGTIAPGNSIGALNVNGNVDFSGGGIYAVEVDDAGNNDVINATGTATLTNGSVQVKPEAGSYNVSTDYTIFTATGGLGGTTFGSASSDLAFLTPTLSYDANNVFLNLRRNTSDYAGVSGTINQAAVGTSLDTFFQTNNDSLDTIYNNLNTLTAEGARQAYDSLSGVQHTHSSQIALQSVNQFQGVLFDRIQGNNALLANNGTVMLAYNDSGTMSDTGPQLLNNSVDTQRGWWLRAIGNEGKIDSTTNASGTQYKAGGIATGFDYNLTNNLTIGTALGYTSANADVEQGRLDADSYQLALYGKLHLNNDYYVSGTAGIGIQKTKASRNVTVGLSSLVATSNYDARTANVAIEGGRTFTLNENTNITPFAGLEYAHVNRDGFTEKGAGSANLKVNSDYQESLRSVIGTRIAHSWTTKQGYQVQPNAELAWVHENMDNESTLRAGFEPATNTSFTVYGPELNRDHARVGLGLNVQFNETTSLNLGYQGEISASDERHDVTATFRMVW